MRPTISSFALAAAAFGCLAMPIAAPAMADPIVFDGTDGGQFGRLDLTTGAFTQISTLTGIVPAGLAEFNKTLYTAAYQGTGFYQLNPGTGATTLISSGGLGGNTFGALGSTLTGVYALDQLGNLYQIAPGTGAATFIGATGVVPLYDPTTNLQAYNLSTGSSALYDSNLNDIYTVNTSTGVATLLGATGASGVGFDALLVQSGTLYGGENLNLSLQGAIYTIDTTTGAGTFGADITPVAANNVPFGLAPSFPIPEPSGLALFGVGLLGLAVRRVRA